MSPKSAPQSSTIKWAPSLIKGKLTSSRSSSPLALRKSAYPNPHAEGATPCRISKLSLLAFLPFDCKTPPPISPCDTPTSYLLSCSYNNNPSKGHMDAAVYAIKYIRQTVDYGIAFHSASPSSATGYLHFPFHHDMEAFSDAVPPSASEHIELTSYSDACWGSQLGNLENSNTEVEMFKLWSMSGYIVLRAEGPIAWSLVWQQQTSRSSCEAEVRTMDECTKEVLSI